MEVQSFYNKIERLCISYSLRLEIHYEVYRVGPRQRHVILVGPAGREIVLSARRCYFGRCVQTVVISKKGHLDHGETAHVPESTDDTGYRHMLYYSIHASRLQ